MAILCYGSLKNSTTFMVGNDVTVNSVSTCAPGCRMHIRPPAGAQASYGRWLSAAIDKATASATLMPSTPADRMPPA